MLLTITEHKEWLCVALRDIYIYIYYGKIVNQDQFDELRTKIIKVNLKLRAMSIENGFLGNM